MTGEQPSNTGSTGDKEVDVDVEEQTTTSSTYKVLGELSAGSGAGVLGTNTAASGTPVGVEGAVPNTDGYGLATPDDARIEGTIDTNETDFIVQAGTTATNDANNVVMGHTSNTATSGVVGATISGGGLDDGSDHSFNRVTADYGTIGGGENNLAGGAQSTISGGLENAVKDGAATVGGGYRNTATGLLSTVAGGDRNTAGSKKTFIGGGKHNTATSGEAATVAGGTSNTAKSTEATVSGGSRNTARDAGATVGGGADNTASGNTATVGGGFENTASGIGATVPGGANNTASGTYSFAAGRKAATSGYEGVFIVGDATSTAVYGQQSNEARFQMPVYAPSHNTTSARTAKTGIEPVNPPDVLARVRSLSVSTWEFTDTDDGRHMGPMAGDFYEVFGLGDDAETIASVDADGVALAAIQGLAEQLDEARNELAEKDDRIEELESRLEAIEAQVGAANQSGDN